MKYSRVSRVSRESSCEGKARFTRHGARISAREMSRKTKETLQAYPCRFCRGWHVGHKIATKKFDRRRLAS